MGLLSLWGSILTSDSGVKSLSHRWKGLSANQDWYFFYFSFKQENLNDKSSLANVLIQIVDMQLISTHLKLLNYKTYCFKRLTIQFMHHFQTCSNAFSKAIIFKWN